MPWEDQAVLPSLDEHTAGQLYRVGSAQTFSSYPVQKPASPANCFSTDALQNQPQQDPGSRAGKSRAHEARESPLPYSSLTTSA